MAPPLRANLQVFYRMPHEVLEMAEFIPEIYLHIEELRSDFKKLSNAEILRLSAGKSNLSYPISTGPLAAHLRQVKYSNSMSGRYAPSPPALPTIRRGHEA